ncbi:MAG: VOC family protein [Phycisphaeraceae bacterium]
MEHASQNVFGVHLYRVIVPVSDIEHAARVYSEVLGAPGTRVSSGRHYFDCGGTILACYDALADGDQQAPSANPEHVYLAVTDLEAAARRVRAAGFAMAGDGIAMQPWGERSFYCHDPFGNPLCFVDRETIFRG